MRGFGSSRTTVVLQQENEAGIFQGPVQEINMTATEIQQHCDNMVKNSLPVVKPFTACPSTVLSSYKCQMT